MTEPANFSYSQNHNIKKEKRMLWNASDMQPPYNAYNNVRHLFDHKFAVADCTFHAEPATNKRSFSAQKNKHKCSQSQQKLGIQTHSDCLLRASLLSYCLPDQQFESMQMMMAKAERFAQQTHAHKLSQTISN
jgi:hypothetical protein